MGFCARLNLYCQALTLGFSVPPAARVEGILFLPCREWVLHISTGNQVGILIFRSAKYKGWGTSASVLTRDA